MNARARMIHRCQIERDAAWGTEIAPGHWADPDWRTHLVQLPCYFWAEPSQGRVQTAERLAILWAYRLLVPAGIDVAERDRIVQITNRNRRLVHQGALVITQIIQRQTWQLLLLEQGN